VRNAEYSVHRADGYRIIYAELYFYAKASVFVSIRPIHRAWFINIGVISSIALFIRKQRGLLNSASFPLVFVLGPIREICGFYVGLYII
jgi:hypothetical protein